MGLLWFDIDSQGYLRLDEVSSNLCCPDLCQNSVLEIPFVRSQSKEEHFSKVDGAKCYHNQNTYQVV